MTKQRYPNTVRKSRSHQTRGIRPFPDHYAACQPPNTSDEHPVDLQIDAIPEIASRRRKLLKMAKRLQRQAPDQAAFIKFVDDKFEYTTLRERAYFNAGFERGLLAGRAESREANAATRALAHQLGLAVAGADLPQPWVAAALLEVARALVLGLPLR